MNQIAYHDPMERICRSPYGAVECGGRIELRLFVKAYAPKDVTLRVWDGTERILTPSSQEPYTAFAERCGGLCFAPHGFAGEDTEVCSFTFTAGDGPGLLWYSFRVDTPHGRFYVGARGGAEGLRLGCRCSHALPADHRITVYRAGFDTPEWFRRGIAYQIFPDRFARGVYPGLEGAMEYHRRMGRRIYPKEWGELPDYTPRDGARFYSPSDYYFGNFAGIIQKIPYLKSLNVSVLYLNPVFESPYNHRYSISDYERIDPLLGSESDFADMCAELKRNGIRVVLDGVFSHTGDDSRYFDRYGRYASLGCRPGAYAGESSPYRKWYIFSDKYKCGYRSWWDFDTLPEVNELEPGYMEFVAGVLQKWMRLGASGWRLDVADELPDEFMRFLRRKVKDADPEALLIGEVWEDASTKKGDADGDGSIKRRGYTDGDMLDGVMDYPFADAVCGFLTGRADAFALRDVLFAQLAGYPDPFMRAQLGMLGSHDTQRVLSVLEGAPQKDTLSREKQAVWQPAEGMRALGKMRLRMAAALQFAMPFAPCIYYGDEAGLEGLSDPFCRRPYPWGDEDEALLGFYRRLAALRAGSEPLLSGETAFAAPNSDSFAVYRQAECGACVVAVSVSGGEIRLAKHGFAGGCEAHLEGSMELYTGLDPSRAEGYGARREGEDIVLDMPAHGIAVLHIK